MAASTSPTPLLLALLLLLPALGAAATLPPLPLSTESRWVVSADGRRVKLACANWASHLEPAAAEGLARRGVGDIAARVAAMGFNCVRLTWPTYLATNATLASLPFRWSLERLGMVESVAGVRVNNPALLDLPLIDVFRVRGLCSDGAVAELMAMASLETNPDVTLRMRMQAVVSSLGEQNVMVILDNHLSKPGWCCSNTDGNGFFGDAYFDPEVWVDGLTRMATMFAAVPNVVGMSLRNELRGPRQNANDWYKYMQRGAEAVHAANPRVLVILSGLSFDNDLAFLNSRAVNLSFTGKAAFEVHWYSFSNSQEWSSGNANQACARITAGVTRRALYLLDKGWPVILSEFGVDNRGVNSNDNRYYGCAAAVAADLDLDWALWALQGSYYLREGVLGLDEVYGVLDWAWCKPRNATSLRRVQALQRPLRGPGLAEAAPYTVLFHPVTGMCVVRRSLAATQPLELGPCNETE
ncbi:hypothetical protein BAE44_0006480, partial [Dichanthelium oligosanthes]